MITLSRKAARSILQALAYVRLVQKDGVCDADTASQMYTGRKVSTHALSFLLHKVGSDLKRRR